MLIMLSPTLAVGAAEIDVTEWLGNEQYAFIPYEAPADISEQLAALERELDSERMRTQMVVSLDPMSRVRDGEKAMLWLDPSRILIFDPRTGENLTRRLSADRQADPSGDQAAVPPQRAG